MEMCPKLTEDQKSLLFQSPKIMNDFRIKIAGIKLYKEGSKYQYLVKLKSQA